MWTDFFLKKYIKTKLKIKNIDNKRKKDILKCELRSELEDFFSPLFKKNSISEFLFSCF